MSTTTTSLKLTKPDVNDKVEDTIAALAANFGILDAMYPIGTIYQSTKSTDPSTFLGGTWTALTGRVLVGAGTDFPAGTTGGEKTHRITVAEMPAHTHPSSIPNVLQNTATGSVNYGFVADGSYRASESSGGGQPMSLMDPYRSVYMWERTA